MLPCPMQDFRNAVAESDYVFGRIPPPFRTGQDDGRSAAPAALAGRVRAVRGRARGAPTRRAQTTGRDLPQRTEPWRVMTEATPTIYRALRDGPQFFRATTPQVSPPMAIGLRSMH
jgi:hypothetical protein